MTIKELSSLINATILSKGNMSREIKSIYVSDLMSDVLTFGREAQLLVTSLTNQQTIRTIEMVEIPAICYTNGKQPDEKTLDLAIIKNITVLATDFSTFQVTGKLFSEGLQG